MRPAIVTGITFPHTVVNTAEETDRSPEMSCTHQRTNCEVTDNQ